MLGYIRAETGMGEAARSGARALQAAGLEFDIFNLDTGTGSSQSDLTWAQHEAARPGYGIILMHVNADSTVRVLLRLPRAFLRDKFVIVHWTWELPEFPDAWRSAFDHVDEVWVPSHFVQSAVAAKSPVPVIRIPYCVRVDQLAAVDRRRFNLPDKRFLFLTMFDQMSFSLRKNPDATLAAFARAFSGAKDGPGLVIKINRPQSVAMNDFCGQQIDALLAQARKVANVYVLDEVLNRADTNALISLCDCFVSLHRAEGFGLVGAESMSLGKPVIQTGWSGNMDYMNWPGAAAVAYKLVPVGTDIGPYERHQFWAEPDVDSAAEWMRRLAGDCELAHALGAAGRQVITDKFSPAVVGKLIAGRLAVITA